MNEMRRIWKLTGKTYDMIAADIAAATGKAYHPVYLIRMSNSDDPTPFPLLVRLERTYPEHFGKQPA